MGTKFSNLNISNNDINTINNENCLYCSKPFTNELWCKECINSLEKLAENGNREAIFNLAIRYEGGNGTEKNLEKAFYWYKKAAENGDADAMNNLAVCYEYGEGIEKNLEKAFYWYQKAAENGVKEAMFNLAMCCYSGEGTEKNLEKAFSWYQNAAEHGNTSTMNNLAGMYYNGEGTEKNLEKAFYWQQRATRSNEWKYHYTCQKKSFSKFIQFCGITKDPNSLNYIIVMSYAKKGSLRKCLSDIIKFKWQDRLHLLIRTQSNS
ncbi:uncharacterized protein OCT59_026935 [Rhizophagus irregularis]|uniref:uncharacterized protein n=1 Tax=Rhizophagus irregularis TaxID=588596 RepID=UPI0033278BB5|nr:hypothetical protein OCT59_026935 [Rhizophagus irregularis]